MCLTGTPNQVSFRVRSGAHSFSGTSFVEDGFIVDMKRFNLISVDEERKEAVIGVGNRVGEVYQALEQFELLMVGGKSQIFYLDLRADFFWGGGAGWVDARSQGFDPLPNQRVPPLNYFKISIFG